MSKKFLIPVGVAVSSLITANASAALQAKDGNKELMKNEANDQNAQSYELLEGVEKKVHYQKGDELHVLMMKKADAGHLLAYHSSHASHASHSSHRSGR